MPINRIVFMNADICFANFRGEERRKRTGEVVNAAGNRNFGVRLTPEKAAELKLAGWNVKQYFSANNTERIKPDFEYLPVTIRFDPYPPKDLYMISGHTKTDLDEKTIDLLQGREFENIDLVISGSYWERNGNSGIKAYLYKGGFTLLLDEFDRKYAYLDENEDGDLPPFEVEESDQAANW